MVRRKSLPYKCLLVLTLMVFLGASGVFPAVAKKDEAVQGKVMAVTLEAEPTIAELLQAIFDTIDGLVGLDEEEKAELKDKIAAKVDEAVSEGLVGEELITKSLSQLAELLLASPEAGEQELEDIPEFLELEYELSMTEGFSADDFYAFVRSYIDQGYSLEEALELAEEEFEGEKGPSVSCPAAPAIAAMLLKGIGNKSGKGKGSVNYISLVARQMGPGTDFNGQPKQIDGQPNPLYEQAVLDFLIGCGAPL